ncbi:hypothetical protein B0H11DRAFT_2205785 [Mycena galericulata]|nr:hypothetical protein B0H11DRAFT_2205785 [Mycena galericulata]
MSVSDRFKEVHYLSGERSNFRTVFGQVERTKPHKEVKIDFRCARVTGQRRDNRGDTGFWGSGVKNGLEQDAGDSSVWWEGPEGPCHRRGLLCNCNCNSAIEQNEVANDEDKGNCYIPSQKGKERPPGSPDVDASPEHPEEDRRFSCRLFSQHHSSEGYRKGCRVIRRMPEATGGMLVEADRLCWSPTQCNRLCGSGTRRGRNPSDRKRSGRRAWEPGLICDSAGDSEDAQKEPERHPMK